MFEVGPIGWGLRAISRGSAQVIHQRSNLFFTQRPLIFPPKSRHHRPRLAARDPCFPILGAHGMAECLQIRHHGRPIFGVVTNRAACLVKLVPELPHRRFDVAFGAVPLEDRLPIFRRDLLIECAGLAAAGSRRRRGNIYIQGKAFRAGRALNSERFRDLPGLAAQIDACLDGAACARFQRPWLGRHRRLRAPAGALQIRYYDHRIRDVRYIKREPRYKFTRFRFNFFGIRIGSEKFDRRSRRSVTRDTVGNGDLSSRRKKDRGSRPTRR